MAPRLTSHYSKNLLRPPFVLGEGRSFPDVLINKGAVYRLIEHDITGDYDCHHCLVVEYANDHDWMVSELEGGNCTLATIARLTGDPTLSCFVQPPVARFAYVKVEFDIEGVKYQGVQIKGAYVNAEHQRGLARQVYMQLLARYGCVFSDNIQTVSGALLWLVGMTCSCPQVHIIDLEKGAFVGQLTMPLTGSLKPWGLTGLDTSYINQNSSPKFEFGDFGTTENRQGHIFMVVSGS
jgi:hypothetical protein